MSNHARRKAIALVGKTQVLRLSQHHYDLNDLLVRFASGCCVRGGGGPEALDARAAVGARDALRAGHLLARDAEVAEDVACVSPASLANTQRIACTLNDWHSN